MLAPGYQNNATWPTEVGRMLVDFKDGFVVENRMRNLADAICQAAEEVAPNADPRRALGTASLKRSTIDSYNRIAHQFAEQWCDYPPVAPLEKLLALIPANSQVLDLGCGPGHHASYIADCGHSVLGVDLSTSMLDIARRRDRRILFQQQDAQKLSFPRHTFDAIWCAAMPMHVAREEFTTFLTGLNRILKPGGIVAINLPVGACSEVIDFAADQRFFENYWSARDVAIPLYDAGFAILQDDYGRLERTTHELEHPVDWLTMFATTVPPVTSNTSKN
ncbi:MAG: class I SAM-dependent methyltransferase [Acidimicrobiales bacterium]